MPDPEETLAAMRKHADELEAGATEEDSAEAVEAARIREEADKLQAELKSAQEAAADDEVEPGDEPTVEAKDGDLSLLEMQGLESVTGNVLGLAQQIENIPVALLDTVIAEHEASLRRMSLLKDGVDPAQKLQSEWHLDVMKAVRHANKRLTKVRESATARARLTL